MSDKTKGNVTYPFSISLELYAQLGLVARKTGLSRAALIRQCIRLALPVIIKAFAVDSQSVAQAIDQWNTDGDVTTDKLTGGGR